MSDLNPRTSLFSHYQFPSHSRKNMTQMSEAKDQVIKLFGKTIQIDEIRNSSLEIRDREDLELDKETSVNTPPTPENCVTQDATTRINDNPKTPFIDNETATLKSSRTEDDHSDTCVSKEKTLRKPDKIISCPRCNSMDTKFCYYNNYNISQPRHFCKKCQRYWTAGGTMRNVHVGAGRRKNKSSGFHFPHQAVSEDLQRAQPNVPIRIHHPPTFRPNGIVFASASSLCESMELKLATKNFNAWNIPYTPRPFSHKHQISICHPEASLGKHTRSDDDVAQSSNSFEEGTSERRLWIPKTLRIDDPKEAVKSSIWETLGIKNETGDSMEWSGGVFKAFQSNGHEKIHTFKACPVSKANPAAMCRSLNFQESS